MKQQLSNAEIVHLTESWFPLFSKVMSASLRDHLAAVPILGIPRKTERACDIHRAARENFRRLCDFTDPLLKLVEEPEGSALDYLICNMSVDSPFAIRWGRYNGTTIRRNRTIRTNDVQEQGYLFGAPDAEIDTMPVVTLGHTIEDEYTEAGIPCWWIGRLYLLRERKRESEVITEVHVFSKPEQQVSPSSRSPTVSARENEIEEWRKLANKIRKSS